MTLKEKYSPGYECWEGNNEPIFRFWIEDQCIGFPFFSLLRTCYGPGDRLILDFPMGAIIVTGPRVWKFYEEFARNCATNLKANKTDIVTVDFVVRDNGKGDDSEEGDNEQTEVGA